ncbi:MAG: IclR family transcriptional regulator, partial [Chloroflexota bacterium]
MLRNDGPVQRVTASQPATTAIKAIEILELLAGDRGGLGLNQIARHLGSTHTSTLRILAALESKGLVTKALAAKRYRPTLRLLELGTKVLDQLDLPEVAKPHLESLCHASGETAHLGVLDGWDLVFVGKAEPANPIHLRARVGARVPSHCTSLGKVLLSALPQARLDEYLATYPL